MCIYIHIYMYIFVCGCVNIHNPKMIWHASVHDMHIVCTSTPYGFANAFLTPQREKEIHYFV